MSCEERESIEQMQVLGLERASGRAERGDVLLGSEVGKLGMDDLARRLYVSDDNVVMRWERRVRRARLDALEELERFCLSELSQVAGDPVRRGRNLGLRAVLRHLREAKSL